jgi:mRNA-degrading endonuclease toxin of MazEF toxin-antitoxin module
MHRCVSPILVAIGAISRVDLCGFLPAFARKRMKRTDSGSSVYVHMYPNYFKSSRVCQRGGYEMAACLEQEIVLRGDVYMTDLDKVRPAVVCSPDSHNRSPRVRKVAVIPFTSLKDGDEWRDDEVVLYPPDGGLWKVSSTMMTDLQWIDRDLLLDRIGYLDDACMRKIDRCVRRRLGMAS